MFLSNCVRRINKIYFNQCLNKTIQTSTCQHGLISQNRKYGRFADKQGKSHLIPALAQKICHQNNHLISLHIRRISTTNRLANRRNKDDDESDDEHEGHSPKLITRPTLYNLVKTGISSFYIRLCIDRDFNRGEFVNGAEYAIEKVTNLFAAGNFDALVDMVDDETLIKLRELIEPMSADDRQSYIVNRSHIKFAVPHEIQFIKKHSDDDEKNRLFIEIMMVFLFEKISGKFYAANYRFVKEFTEGIDDDWTINHIQHGEAFNAFKIHTDHT